MAETPSYADNLPCYGGYCETCNYPCHTTVSSFPIIFPPPPPPPPSPSQNHIAPFIIATVSVLGISFLLLLTCTVVFRLSFKRRRRDSGGGNSLMNNNDGELIVDHPIWHIATVGLQQSVIDSITAFKYKKIDGFFIDGTINTTDCSVCLTEFEEGDDLRLLPKCTHAFHVSCIDTWLRSHKTCPLCRAPVVNETEGGNLGGQLNSGEFVLRLNMDEHGEGEGSTSSNQLSENGNNSGELPKLEGVKIAEILSNNRELRVFSDLGEYYRFRGLGEGLEPVRRSISLNAIDASMVCRAMVVNEGSSIDGSSRVLEEKKIDSGKRGNKRGSSMSGLLWKKSSSGCSLQKGPLSMKRSLSSRSKFFSFRRTRSQAPILPL